MPAVVGRGRGPCRDDQGEDRPRGRRPARRPRPTHHSGHSCGGEQQAERQGGPRGGDDQHDPRAARGSSAAAPGTPKAPTRAAIWKIDALGTGAGGGHARARRAAAAASQAVTPVVGEPGPENATSAAPHHRAAPPGAVVLRGRSSRGHSGLVARLGCALRLPPPAGGVGTQEGQGRPPPARPTTPPAPSASPATPASGTVSERVSIEPTFNAAV